MGATGTGRVVLVGGLLAWLALGAAENADRPTGLRFEVTLAQGLVAAPQQGRLLVVLGRQADPEPRFAIGEAGLQAAPLLGRNVVGLNAANMAIVDQSAAVFPLRNLRELKPGRYIVQAVLMTNRDLHYANAESNLCSEPVAVRLDPASGQSVRLMLTRRIREPEPPQDPLVRFVKVRSERLSRFHGRPYDLHAGVILPRDYAQEPGRRYPLRVHIGGYGTRFSNVAALMAPGAEFRGSWLADDCPRMILLHLDGAGPFGDPYQVNSANNGPYGDAVVSELIPAVEAQFRGLGDAAARVLDGASTGGWVSLALQIYYPNHFNGAWAHAPDPVDFRAYELINIYQDKNAYVNAHGFERPASRDRNGEVRTTVRHECQMEMVLGHDNLWTLSGKDWCAWNAVFGPRGADGRPVPLWDGRTGQIDRAVLEHWKQYDLRQVLEKHWQVLGPSLRGKLHVWVGEADEYFLNNAVHLLDEFLQQAKPRFDGTIRYGAGKGHDWDGLTERDMMMQMAARMR